jgi:hypothetical protein
VDAAVRLVNMENAARSSYGTHQKTRVQDIIEHADSLRTALNKVATETAINVDGFRSVEDDVTDIHDLVEKYGVAYQDEQTRRDNLDDSEGILEPNVLRTMQNHRSDEKDAEISLMGSIQALQLQLDSYQTQVAALTVQLKSLQKQSKLQQNLEATKASFGDSIRVLSASMHAELVTFLETIPTHVNDLEPHRRASLAASEAAIVMVKKRQKEVADQMESGIFEGLSPDLVPAVKFFLSQAYNKIRPEGALSDSSIGFVGGNQPSSSNTRRAEQKVEEGTYEVNENVDRANDEIDEQIRAFLTDHSRSDNKNANSIEAKLQSLDRLQKSLEAALREEARLKGQQLKELMNESSFQLLEPEEYKKVEDARLELDKMTEIQEREVESMVQNSREDRDEQMMHELNALREEEKDSDLKMKSHQDALELALNNIGVENREERSEEEKHLYEVQAQEIEHHLQEATERCLEELARIHQNSTAELNKQKRALYAAQDLARQPFRDILREALRNTEIRSHPVVVNGINLTDVKNALAADDGKLSEQQEAMERLQLEQNRDNEKQRMEEARRKEAEDDRNALAEEKRAEQQVADARANEQKALEEKLRLDIEQADGNEELIAQAQAEYEKRLEAANQSHENDLRARRAQIEQRKRARKLAREQKLRETKRREQRSQEAAKAELKRNSVRDREEEFLRDAVTGKNKTADKQMIEFVLSTRHSAEESQISQQQLQEQSEMIQAGLQTEWENVNHQKEQLQIAQNGPNALSDEDYKRALQALDERDEKENIVEDVRQRISEKYRKRQIELNDVQVQEIKDLFLRWYPTEDFSGPEWQVSHVDLEEMRRRRERERKAEEERLAHEMREMQDRFAQLQRDNEELRKQKLSEWQQGYDEKDEQNYREELAREEAKLQQEHDLEIAAREEQFNQAMADPSLTQQERDDLEREYLSAVERANGILGDKRRQARKRIDAARAARRQRQEAKMKAQLDREQESLEKEQKEQMQHEAEAAAQKRQEQKEATRKLVKSAVERMMKIGQKRSQDRSKGIVLALQKLRSNAKLYCKSMQDQLQRAGLAGHISDDSALAIATIGAFDGKGNVEDRLRNNLSHAVAGGSRNSEVDNHMFLDQLDGLQNQLAKLSNTDDGRFAAYEEPGEQDLLCSGKVPIIKIPEELDARQFVLYRYGGFIVKFLNLVHHQPPVELHFATSLPVKEHPRLYTRNAFRNSFHWIKGTRELFIRLERAVDPGQLTLLITHVLAHARVGHWGDDHPQFIAQYSSSMKLLCSEFFFMRVKRTTVSQHPEDLGSLGFRDAFALLKHGLSMNANDGVVSDLLELTREGTVNSDEMNSVSVFSRLKEFEIFARSAQLKKHLLDLELNINKKRETLAIETKHIQETPRVKLMQRIEYLETISDGLNEQLLDAVSDLQQSAETLQTMRDEGRDPDDIDEQENDVHAKNVQKEDLLKRLTSLERRRARIQNLLRELS